MELWNLLFTIARYSILFQSFHLLSGMNGNSSGITKKEICIISSKSCHQNENGTICTIPLLPSHHTNEADMMILFRVSCSFLLQYALPACHAIYATCHMFLLKLVIKWQLTCVFYSSECSFHHKKAKNSFLAFYVL